MTKSKSIIEQVVEDRAAGKKAEPVDMKSIIGQVAAKNAEISATARDKLAAELADERSYDGIPEADKKRLFPKALELVRKYNELMLDTEKNERNIMFTAGALRDIDYEVRNIADFYSRNSERIADLNKLAVKLGEKGLAKDLAGLEKQLEGMKKKPFYGKVTELDDLRREKFENYLHQVQEKLQKISEDRTGDYPRFG